MDEFVLTCFHYEDTLVEGPNPSYKGELGVFAVPIDKDHFGLIEFLSYTKDLGYETVGGFYCRHENSSDFVKINSDSYLLDYVSELNDGDELDVYVIHVIDDLEECPPQEPLLDESDTGLDIVPFDESVIDNEANVEGRVDVGLDGVDTGLDGIDADLDEGGSETYLPSSESDSDAIPDEDGSDVDEELRAFRAEKRNRNNCNPNLNPRKKRNIPEEVAVGEAGIDKGFEDIGRNKKERYVGRLAGDEEFIDSSNCDSDDSTDLLDVEAVSGVDLPARRKSRRVRYDDKCEITVFELGMIFKGVKEFRKALAKYAVQNKVQIKLRPNEAHRVRAKCKFNDKCKWVCYGAIDRDSGNFMIKNYHPVHKCHPSNKNKMCTTKFLADRFKDEIIKQPTMKIWEIQEMCRKVLELYIGKTICYKAKMQILRESMGDWNMKFARLCDYADMIKQTNPGSSVWVRMDKEAVPGKNFFVYFYVCLDALKKGWKEGCRRFIEFDDYFLKGACKGELLVAVSRNGNNQMYPIAWAVVDKETKHSWSFFIQFLKDDLELGNGEGLTVMTDMQKGFHAALFDLLPNAEVRRCARHIWSNWSQK